ncbi:MAG: hypothetical protein ACYDGY_01360 [Acidimicrobiales bacterium]
MPGRMDDNDNAAMRCLGAGEPGCSIRWASKGQATMMQYEMAVGGSSIGGTAIGGTAALVGVVGDTDWYPEG